MAAVIRCSVFEIHSDQDLIFGLREITGLVKPQEAIQHHVVSSFSEGAPEVQKDSSTDGRRKESTTCEVPDRRFCSACQCSFESREDQMDHYKLDWHRFNLKQKLMGKPTITVDEFETKTGTGEMSSISGSDSDEEESESDMGCCDEVTSKDTDGIVDTESMLGRLSIKVVFQNAKGQYLSMHRCVLHGKNMDNDEGSVSSLLNITCKTVWVVLMTGGGHFAGAVFRGREVLQHKTFHRYTVRAKRGTAQGLRDAQNRSHAPKSAGAALRRYNEAALVKDIQDLLESWSEHLKEASVIFLRAPSYNKTIFFGGRAAPLNKNDPRVRVPAFATRRATFREVKRVHDVLSTIQVYEKETEVSSIFSPSRKVWTKRDPKPVLQTSPEDVPAAGEEESSEEDCSSMQLETVELTLDTLHLREYEVYPNRRRRRRRKEKNRAEKEESGNRETDQHPDDMDVAACEHADGPDHQGKPKAKRKPKTKKHQLEKVEADETWEYGLRDALFTACKTGDVDTLHNLLQLPDPQGEDKERSGSDPQGSTPEEPGPVGTLGLLNRAIDSAGFTLLHVASASGQKAVIQLLMDAGSDPACKDKKGQTPYGVAPEKDTRNTFRKYMADHPCKYDYAKAQVPAPLTSEIETKKMEKKKAQKAAKRQREKEQREEKQRKEQEEEERKRFTALSDREKRALAAERRLAEQIAGTGASIRNSRRCWQCGESLLGKVPFEYLDFSFCSPRCVQAHRRASTLAAQP